MSETCIKLVVSGTDHRVSTEVLVPDNSPNTMCTAVSRLSAISPAKSSYESPLRSPQPTAYGPAISWFAAKLFRRAFDVDDTAEVGAANS
jgi:hypothetical protein